MKKLREEAHELSVLDFTQVSASSACETGVGYVGPVHIPMKSGLYPAGADSAPVKLNDISNKRNTRIEHADSTASTVSSMVHNPAGLAALHNKDL